MGKAYANKKQESDRPQGDYYPTPKSLIWLMKDAIQAEFPNDTILEPCSGDGAISKELDEFGYPVITNDLYNENAMENEDYLQADYSDINYVITNPPFSLWDDFVNKSKTHCRKFMMLGRTNYFGSVGRYKNDLWKNLKTVYIFNRYVDYRTPYREDGHFHVGALCTGWFLWDMDYNGKPQIEILDVQKYATLGGIK